MSAGGTARVGRRALLAASAASVVTAAAHALLPDSTPAADHDPVRIGETNSGSSETILRAPSSHGLSALSDAGDGIRGGSSAAQKSGLYGFTSHAEGYGVFGRHTPSGATGFVGGRDVGVSRRSSTMFRGGVEGERADTGGFGVVGHHAATAATGFLGAAEAGVMGWPPPAGGWARSAYGPLQLQTSGLAVIAANRSSVAVHYGYVLTSAKVLATLQVNRAGVFIGRRCPTPSPAPSPSTSTGR